MAEEKTQNIVIKPIGFVKNNVKEQRIGNFTDETSEIILNEEFTEALDGIEDYSHIIVVYFMDKIKEYVLKHQPQANPDVPEVGIFACRCPKRPNPIAITTCLLVKREKNKLFVKGLDTLNNTPIIDIKPYWIQYDKPKEAIKIPDWVNKLKF